jgi:hypothetical protein
MRSVIFWILDAIIVIPLALWLYIWIGGLVARWWLPERIKRSSDRGKTPDSIERALLKDVSIIVGVFWPITLSYFFVTWSWLGSGIARFVLWAWTFSSTNGPKLSKAEAHLRKPRKHQM